MLKDLIKAIPPIKRHLAGVRALVAERDALRQELAGPRVITGPFVPPTQAPTLSTEQQALVDRFHDLFYQVWDDDHVRLNIGWLGHRTYKCPLDLWVYQELLVEQRPDAIIETGTRFGGSALFMACICDLLGHGRVITVDLDPAENLPQHPRITYIRGSSTDPAIIDRIRQEVPAGAKSLIVLDSDHSRAHVHQECRLYQQFVQVGGYMVVEDTNVNGHPTYPTHGPGPMEGMEDFLAETTEFVSDPARERFLLTMNPKGYLRRIDPVLKPCLAERPQEAPPAPADKPAPDVVAAAAAVADSVEPGPRPEFADSIILQHVDLTGIGLEVGPLCFPKVPPEHPGIHYADWASREELQKKYADDPVVKAENIVPIHFVIGSRTFPEAVGDKKFDYVILSHVIEHFPDMIGRLAEIASILTPKGVISLVVPDKRYTFDRLRPLTRLAEVIEAHVLGRKEPGVAQIFEHAWLWHEVDAVTAWHSPETLPQTATNDPAWALTLARTAAASHDYIDVHCGVFTDLSFLVLLQQIVQLGLLPLELVHFSPVAPETNQFFLTLRLQPDRDHAVTSFDAAIEQARQQDDPMVVKIRGLEQQIDALMTSSSWQMTAPLRRLKERLGQ